MYRRLTPDADKPEQERRDRGHVEAEPKRDDAAGEVRRDGRLCEPGGEQAAQCEQADDAKNAQNDADPPRWPLRLRRHGPMIEDRAGIGADEEEQCVLGIRRIFRQRPRPPQHREQRGEGDIVNPVGQRAPPVEARADEDGEDEQSADAERQAGQYVVHIMHGEIEAAQRHGNGDEPRGHPSPALADFIGEPEPHRGGHLRMSARASV